MADINTDIRYLKGVGERRAQLLRRLGVSDVGALLHFYPRRYEDWSAITPIFADNLDMTVCVRARVVAEAKEQIIRKNMKIYKLAVEDSSGRMQVTFFNSGYTAMNLRLGQTYLFYGKMTGTPFLREMTSPKVATTAAGMMPVYNLTKGVNSKFLQGLVRQVLDTVVIRETLPQDIIDKYKLCSLLDALKGVHFPKDAQDLARARYRLIFEELFMLQAGMILLRSKAKADAGAVIKSLVDEFFSSLKFEPTLAQRRVTEECLRDMASGKAMNRLVQGDVGSGKTLVAAALIFAAAKSGYQSALMAPTELLAEQHFETLSKFFAPFGIKCICLTGAVTGKRRTAALETLSSGEAVVAVGTQALFSEKVRFKNLALVVTDEQHRFGVRQRGALYDKGNSPHTLVMSATPIPRTLAMTIYGDLDISIVDEYPKGRQPIETYCVTPELHERLYKFIDRHIDEGRQVYFVCPLVENDEDEENGSGIKSAIEWYEELSIGRFKDRRVGLLHGKMKPAEKDAVMRLFEKGEIDLLVCTTVVEVGIDVPNSALMVVENAERFGLSQLHQLRGRIGRGKFKSTCVLVTDSKSHTTKQRMDVLCKTRDGFVIADEDLKQRGPGDFLGKRQHGLPELKIADMAENLDILRISGRAAVDLISKDKTLSNPEHVVLRQAIDGLMASTST